MVRLCKAMGATRGPPCSAARWKPLPCSPSRRRRGGAPASVWSIPVVGDVRNRLTIAFALAGALACAPAAAVAAKPVSVLRGKSYGHRIFPSDAFTVKDKRQLTGRRVHFRRGRDFPIVKGHLKRRCDT